MSSGVQKIWVGSGVISTPRSARNLFSSCHSTCIRLGGTGKRIPVFFCSGAGSCSGGGRRPREYSDFTLGLISSRICVKSGTPERGVLLGRVSCSSFLQSVVVSWWRTILLLF